MQKRAEEMAETHLRITEAAIELHGTVGPSRTTMSAVAKRAGVERRTLYRHFPTEAGLFAACSSHYFTANPWPDLDDWRAIRDPQQRLERGLEELYAYYERTGAMFGNVLRDAELVDFARDAVAPLQAYLEEAAEVLTVGRKVRGRRRELSAQHCATPSPFQRGARCRPTGSGDRMRRSSSPRSLKAQPRHSRPVLGHGQVERTGAARLVDGGVRAPAGRSRGT